MPNLRVAAAVAAVAVLATAAYAVTEIRLPTRAKAKATLNVDETGAILFGSVPGRVEVSNFPTADADDDPGMLWNWSGSLSGSLTAFTVPADQMLVVTDVIASVSNSATFQFRLSASGSTRLQYILNLRQPLVANLRTGLEFPPGSQVRLSLSPTTTSRVTLSGLLFDLP